jgi:aquaporin Z
MASSVSVRVQLGIWGAEAVGTAVLVLGALSAVAFVLGEGSPLARLPMSLRLAITGVLVGVCVALIAVSPLGRLSGAHINPAVTVGFWIVRMVRSRDLAGYVGAQLAGAVVGGYLFRWSWGRVALSVGGGVTHPSVSIPVALALEAGMTALLMAMILLFVSRTRLTRWTPVMLVPLLAVLVWRGSSYTGTSLNPARSEGPAIAFGDLADLWLYFAGPLPGAVAAATTWRYLRPAQAPKTAKLFHDPRYPCTLRTELAVWPAGRPALRQLSPAPGIPLPVRRDTATARISPPP